MILFRRLFLINAEQFQTRLEFGEIFAVIYRNVKLLVRPDSQKED